MGLKFELSKTGVLVQMKMHLEEIVKERVGKKTPIGVIFSRVDPDGVQQFPYGFISNSGMETPDAQTVFEIGSSTKVLLAVLLTRLEELGFCSLDDPIRNYLSSSVYLPEYNQSQITFLDILTHTSALPRMPPNFDFDKMPHSFASYDVDDLYIGLEQTVLSWEPGKSYVYSNFGYALLGHVVEQITNLNWDQLIVKYICDPLGMNHTRFGTSDLGKNVATSHLGERPVPSLRFRILGAAGGLTSTANDMSIFLSHNLGFSESVVSSSIVKTQRMNYQESTIFGLGLGWHIQRRDERNLIWHRGETHGQTSFMVFSPKDETGIVMLSNSAFSGCCSDLALSQIDSSIVPTEQEPHTVQDISLISLRSFEGVYALDPFITFLISAEEGRLKVKVTGQPGATMYSVSSNQFETEDQRVIIKFSGDRESITIKQHGIDRIARKL